MRSIKNNKNQGVALLYAVLLVSIVLTISLSLLNITYKQIVLTAVSRESQVAHFNAWSATDCIARTNRKFRNPGSVDDSLINPFGVFNFSDDPDTLVPPTGASTTFTCGDAVGDRIEATVISPPNTVQSIGVTATGILSRYKLTGSGLNEACAILGVAKGVIGEN